MAGVEHRNIWSLSTGKLLEECDIDDTPDASLHRKLDEPDDLRVEITLRNAMVLFKRKGPDVADLFSQPRVCKQLGGRTFDGEVLRPGWSFDRTMNDPRSGKPWDLSLPGVQGRVRKLVKSTQPFCIIGSPPCTPFSKARHTSTSAC